MGLRKALELQANCKPGGAALCPLASPAPRGLAGPPSGPEGWNREVMWGPGWGALLRPLLSSTCPRRAAQGGHAARAQPEPLSPARARGSGMEQSERSGRDPTLTHGVRTRERARPGWGLLELPAGGPGSEAGRAGAARDPVSGH